MSAHWEILQHVVSEDIMIYQQLARTQRSMGYSKNILSERECKIGKYHQNMERLIQDRG